jgi:hypothetical protein
MATASKVLALLRDEGLVQTRLYRHVRDKDALLALMVDETFRLQRTRSTPSPDWQVGLKAETRAQWQTFPPTLWLASALSISRPTPRPSGVAYSDRVLRLLLTAGFTADQAFSLHLVLLNLLRGFATSVEAESASEVDSGLTADEWMDTQRAALEDAMAGQSSTRAHRAGWFDQADLIHEFHATTGPAGRQRRREGCPRQACSQCRSRYDDYVASFGSSAGLELGRHDERHLRQPVQHLEAVVAQALLRHERQRQRQHAQHGSAEEVEQRPGQQQRGAKAETHAPEQEAGGEERRRAEGLDAPRVLVFEVGHVVQGRARGGRSRLPR